MAWFFSFFLVSGFCSLVYQVVWLRLAMAAFGVTTPLVSLVLSVFMAGLAVGSWGVGRLARRLSGTPARAIRLYAVAELVIGLSGIVVPRALGWGRELLAAGAWDSTTYYLASGAWIALTILPFCAAMGATFPLAMAAIHRQFSGQAERSFSYLYLANVVGATSGTLVSAFILIELVGFNGTVSITAALNVLLAAAAFVLSLSTRSRAANGAAVEASPKSSSESRPPRLILLLLFLTGLTSMALEVVWIRQFTPYLGTFVYAFAAILATYLVATFVGSGLYRRRVGSPGGGGLGFVSGWAGLGFLGLLPLLTTDPGLHMPAPARLVIGIAPFCAALGFLTPMLVDRWSRGDPDRAGSAYAVNVVGSIVGPLVAGFWLLPELGERQAGVALTLPLFAVGLAVIVWTRRFADAGDLRRVRATTLFVASVVVSVAVVGGTRGFETLYPKRQIRRDHNATVIAVGAGLDKRLVVNGQGMTTLKPVTKMMAHLPLAALDRPPRDAVVVAFGMGTTFRSLLSWGIPVTAVELVPSVPRMFGFFHADADALVASPHARIVVDDGRRFLERYTEELDVITVDPPPPVEAAGSSLLYSREFYAVARKRLRPDGILQQWLPGGELAVVASVTRALTDSFPHVRVFHSFEGWGGHFLASLRPIDMPPASVLAARMPPSAVADMLEWGPATTAGEQFRLMLDREMSVASLLAFAPTAPAMSDDRPYNEYFFLRYYLGNSR